jgi:hypothetical protein
MREAASTKNMRRKKLPHESHWTNAHSIGQRSGLGGIDRPGPWPSAAGVVALVAACGGSGGTFSDGQNANRPKNG